MQLNRSVLAVQIVLLLAACGGVAPSRPAATDAVDAADAEEDASDTSDAAVDVARPIDCGTGKGGVHWCCGAPGEAPGQSCEPMPGDGGLYGSCRNEGQEIEGKVVGAECCEGLTRVSLLEASDAGCAPTGVPSLLVCARCGDGVCGIAENRCNCPADCP